MIPPDEPRSTLPATSTNRRATQWLASTLVCCVVGCSHLFHVPPRPPVEQLLFEAAEASAERRAREAELFAPPTTETGNAGETVRVGEPTPPAVALPEADAPLLSEELIEIDVREAVGLLASEVGADVLMDDRVRGVVNVTIEDAPFDEALEKVLLPLGFVVGRRGEQYVVSPPDPDSPLFPFVSTHVEYRPKHLSPKALLAAPPQQMLKFVREVEGSDTLIIEAPTQYSELILERIRALDRPVPQVELEAIVCVVEPDSGFRFGLDWGHAVQLNGQDAFNLGASGLALSGVVTPQGLDSAFSDFATTSAFVRLLAENGYLTIRASPRVVAEHGKQANIKINRQTYFALQPQNAAGDNAFFFQQDIETVEAGIELEITPRVRGDLVTIDIDKAEVSEDISPSAVDGGTNSFPVINRRSVSTTVHVEDGKTIVIGGLVQRETVDRVNRVPGLSRIPGLGYFFKSVEREAREAEIVIFIAPRIVKPATSVTECVPLLTTPTETASDATPRLHQPAEILPAP